MGVGSSSMNNDVATEILLHLPVESLLRLRSVSKCWRDMIDSSHFRKLHVEKQMMNNIHDDMLFLTLHVVIMPMHKYWWRSWRLSIMFPNRNLKSSTDLPAFQKFFERYGLKTERRRLRVLGPINGLICIGDRHLERGLPNVPIIICNPSLDKMKILPTTLSLSKSCYGLISRDLGFGYDKATDDYKVVQLVSCYKHHRIHVYLYSRNTNTWRELGTTTTTTLDRVEVKTAIKSSCKKGAFAHWLGVRTMGRGGELEHIILSFDMKNEVFRTTVMHGYESMAKRKTNKIFAKDDGVSFRLFFYSVFNYEREDQPYWVTIFESEGNINDRSLYWNKVNILGPFNSVIRPKTLWKRDGVVFKHINGGNTRMIFYEPRGQDLISCFDMPVRHSTFEFKIFEYKGTFISP